MRIRNTRRAAITLPSGQRIEANHTLSVGDDEWLALQEHPFTRGGYLATIDEPPTVVAPEEAPVIVLPPPVLVAKAKRSK